MTVLPCTPAILWGTTAHKSFGTRYYSGLQKMVEGVNVPLHRAGLGRVKETHEVMIPILEGLRDDNGVLILAGHSQGGLIANLHAARFPDTFVVNLDTPNHGTGLCHFIRLVPGVLSQHIIAFADMRTGSYFMRWYEEEVLPVVAPNLVSIATTHDKLVPVGSSIVAGARNVVVVAESDRKDAHKYASAHGGAIELMFEEKMGHITSVIKRGYQEIVRDLLSDRYPRLVQSA